MTAAALRAADRELEDCGLRGRKVALRIADPLTLARALLLLDGRCAELLLVPPASSGADAARLVSAARSELLLEDAHPAPERGPLWSALGHVRVSSCGPPPSGAEGPRAAGEETTWIVATSGTTRAPRLVAHSLASLTDATRATRGCSRRLRWALMYELGRMAGLQVFLHALLGGEPLVLFRAAGFEERVREAAAAGVTAISATPTLWRKLLMTPAHGALRLSQITLGGEHADDRILSALRATWPGARLTHVYASTEAGFGFSVSDGREGFPASLVGAARNGVDVRVDPDGGLLLRKRSSARELLEPGRAAPVVDADGFIHTGDLVERRGDRYVFVGRANGSINVGGNKVHPEEVERILLSHPDVLHARVSGKRNAVTGHVVVASIVCRRGVGDPARLRAELVHRCAATLPAHKVPALLRFDDAIPLTETGKTSRADA